MHVQLDELHIKAEMCQPPIKYLYSHGIYFYDLLRGFEQRAEDDPAKDAAVRDLDVVHQRPHVRVQGDIFSRPDPAETVDDAGNDALVDHADHDGLDALRRPDQR